MLLKLKREALLSCAVAYAFRLPVKVMAGESPHTELRYMPRPAGLMPIEAMSPPSAVKAPPMAATRPVVNE